MCLSPTDLYFFLSYRGQSGSIEREQVPQHDGTWQSVWRIGNTLQLQEDSHHKGGDRLSTLGHRATMLPDHHDAYWSDKTGGVHGLPEEVSIK